MKKTNWKFLAVLATLGTGALVWAAGESVDRSGSQKPTQFIKGVYVGPESTFNPSADTKNKITRSVGCTLDYDFPSTSNGYVAVSVDKVGACTGVKLGDPCSVGVAKATPSDAGSAAIPYVVYQAIAYKDDFIRILAHMDLADGGAEDLPDAGYNVRCTSNQ